LSERQILPTQSATRLQARCSSDSPQNPGGHLPYAFPPGLLQRIRRSLSRQTQQTPPDSKPSSSLGASRLYRDTRAESCVTPNVRPLNPIFIAADKSRVVLRSFVCGSREF